MIGGVGADWGRDAARRELVSSSRARLRVLVVEDVEETQVFGHEPVLVRPGLLLFPPISRCRRRWPCPRPLYQPGSEERVVRSADGGDRDRATRRAGVGLVAARRDERSCEVGKVEVEVATRGRDGAGGDGGGGAGKGKAEVVGEWEDESPVFTRAHGRFCKKSAAAPPPPFEASSSRFLATPRTPSSPPLRSTPPPFREMNRIGIGAGASLPVDGRGRGKGRAPRPSSVRFPLKREFAGETTLRIARARVPPLAIEARRVRVTASDPPIEDPLEGVRELFAEVDDPNTTAPPGGNGSDKLEDAAPVEDVVDKTLGARAGAGRHILSDEDAVNFVFEVPCPPAPTRSAVLGMELLAEGSGLGSGGGGSGGGGGGGGGVGGVGGGSADDEHRHRLPSFFPQQDRRRGWIHSSSSVKLSGGVMGCSLQHAHVPALEASQATPPSAMATEALLLGDAHAGEDDEDLMLDEPQEAENVGAAAPAAL
uniref:Uncharacterized protein n=1 Tax=Oryza glaberrima TaxID=4538 RepID=I1QUT8_ORYGL